MPRSPIPIALALLCASCSTDPNAEARSPTGGERDIELKHEPCDGSSSSATRVDVNGDGKPDIIHVMNGKREICRIVDLNLDGAVDAFIYYDANGNERRRESDFDRDGRADEIAFFVGGAVIRKERETNFDNKIDTWDYYEHGRLVRRERDSDGDKVVDQWWQFNDPSRATCALVATDRNTDGKPDPETLLDLCGESYGTAKLGSASAPGATSAATPPSPAPTAATSAPSTAAPPASAIPSAPDRVAK